MSNEEGVTLFETAHDAVLYEVTPQRGKGTLGIERAVTRWRNGALTPNSPIIDSLLSSCGVDLVSAGCMCASA